MSSSSSSSSRRLAATPYSVTKAPKDEYDFRELDDTSYQTNHPDLREALRREVRHFTVEFLYTDNQAKPHVVFKLNLKTAFQSLVRTNDPEAIVRAALLSMELAGSPEGQEAGAGQIKLVCYADRTDSASVAFRFNLLEERTLHDFIKVITGEHIDLQPTAIRGNLARFDFVEMGHNDLYDGCRDWIAQAFYRYNTLGWVDWEVGDLIGPPKEDLLPRNNSVPPIIWATAGFHDVIGKYYTEPSKIHNNNNNRNPSRGSGGSSNSRGSRHRGSSSRDEEEKHTVYYTLLPLERGIFHSTQVVRQMTDWTGRYALPYRPLAAPGSASGGSRRGGGGGGPASGRGGGSGGGSGDGGDSRSGYPGTGATRGSGSGQGSGSGRGSGGRESTAVEYSTGNYGRGSSASGQASSSSRSNNPPRGAEHVSSSSGQSTASTRPKESANTSGGWSSTLSKAMRGLGISGSSSSSKPSTPATEKVSSGSGRSSSDSGGATSSSSSRPVEYVVGSGRSSCSGFGNTAQYARSSGQASG